MKVIYISKEERVRLVISDEGNTVYIGTIENPVISTSTDETPTKIIFEESKVFECIDEGNSDKISANGEIGIKTHSER